MADAGDFLALFDTAVRASPAGPALHYFDGTISYRALDAQSDAFAAWLIARGMAEGDRMLVCLQNVPGFVIALLGAAKAGVITVPINPMYRERELRGLIEDCAPSLLVCHPGFQAVADAAAFPADRRVIVRATDRQRENPPHLPDEGAVAEGAALFDAVTLAGDDKPVRPRDRDAGRPLLIVYTSGTTGKPKGVVLSHANLCAGADFYRRAAHLGNGDAVLAAAPLFHVTGLSGHIGAAIAASCPLVLAYRFQPDVILAEMERHRPTFTVAAVTALSALIDCPGFARERIASLRALFSGGAPIPPALARRIDAATGLSLRNVYGLTETTAPVVATPEGAMSPVDPASGALALGKAVAGSDVTVLGPHGEWAESGEVGEIAVRGPSVFGSYWRKPEETAAAFRDGWFLTGDMGCRDDAGWLFLVDRKKDMIVASGFKIWPREVEDVLYGHPAVREAGVVGVPDAYRGETVKAVVSLHPGASCTGDEIIAFCRARMAAFKCPRVVEIVDELPKTLTGKVLRRELSQPR
jgi:long-chain acyl-CoA synthetase